MNDTIKYTRRTFEIEDNLAQSIASEAFWLRCTGKEVVNKALREYFKDKKYKQIPSDLIPTKRGRTPT